jgi:hypothetical protein
MSARSQRSTTRVNDDAKRRIDGTLQRLSRVSLGSTRRYGALSVPNYSFVEWLGYAENVKDPDEVRNALYYGFQPLFDALIDEHLEPWQRQAAVQALDQVSHLSAAYLTSYYEGEPNTSLVRTTLSKLKPDIAALAEVSYNKKSRNIDRNGIVPGDILLFLQGCIGSALDGSLPLPDYVVGSACGASEIVFALTGVLGVDADFIRKSKRRYDSEPRIIAEQRQRLVARTADRNVLCVEDYVCTGGSLRSIMREVENYRPAEITGASVNLVKEGGFSLRVEKVLPKFRLYGDR